MKSIWTFIVLAFLLYNCDRPTELNDLSKPGIIHFKTDEIPHVAIMDVSGSIDGEGHLVLQSVDSLIKPPDFSLKLSGKVDTSWREDWYFNHIYLAWYPQGETSGSLTIKLNGFDESID